FGRQYNLRGCNPAARTASFHLGKSRKTEYLETPERAMNSISDGVWPSRLATAAMEIKICRLLCMDYFGVRRLVYPEPAEGLPLYGRSFTIAVPTRAVITLSRGQLPVLGPVEKHTLPVSYTKRRLRPLLCGLRASSLCDLCVQFLARENLCVVREAR